jgi:hypothetical protein
MLESYIQIILIANMLITKFDCTLRTRDVVMSSCLAAMGRAVLCPKHTRA